MQFAQKSEQVRLLQQTLDEKRSELLRAEAKLRDTEERLYAGSVSVNDKVKDDLRVIQIQIQIQMGICRARLTNCPGALTNVRMLCETGEL